MSSTAVLVHGAFADSSSWHEVRVRRPDRNILVRAHRTMAERAAARRIAR